MCEIKNREVLNLIENDDTEGILDEVSEQIVSSGGNVADILEMHWELSIDNLKEIFLEGNSSERDSAYEVFKRKANSVYDWFFIYNESNNVNDIQYAKEKILNMKLSISGALFLFEHKDFKDHIIGQFLSKIEGNFSAYKKLLLLSWNNEEVSLFCFIKMLHNINSLKDLLYVLKKIYEFYEEKMNENNLNVIYKMIIESNKINLSLKNKLELSKEEFLHFFDENREKNRQKIFNKLQSLKKRSEISYFLKCASLDGFDLQDEEIYSIVHNMVRHLKFSKAEMERFDYVKYTPSINVLSLLLEHDSREVPYYEKKEIIKNYIKYNPGKYDSLNQ